MTFLQAFDKPTKDVSEPLILTGMGGVLGWGIARVLSAARNKDGAFLALGRTCPPHWPKSQFQNCDLASPGELRKLMRRLQPRAVLNAAALTRIDLCEAQPTLANRVNVEAVKECVDAAVELGIDVVQVSTEQVFSGAEETYSESSGPAPLHRYGKTKWQAEECVLGKGGAVARIPLLLGPCVGPGRCGADGALAKAFEERQKMTLFTDEIRVPASAALVAAGLLDLVNNFREGVFHFAGSTPVTRFDLGTEVWKRMGGSEPKPFAAGRAQDLAPHRPRKLVLLCERARRHLGWTPPQLERSLRDVLL